jgi:3-oxoadipate enol-lactonase
MPFAQLSDLQIHYDLRGQDTFPVLLFSNSLGTTLEMWDSQIEEFTKRFRVLRYDTRGHGRSGVTPGEYTIPMLADDVLQLLDFLHLDRVHFCGLSMGGAIGIDLGSRAPQRFYKLALCDTAAKFGTAETWHTRIRAVEAGGMRAVAGSVLGRWFTSAFREAHPDKTRVVLAMLENADPQGYVSNCAAVRDFDARQSLGNVRVPCLVLTGTDDPVTTPADARYLAGRIPSAQYAEVSAAHLSNIEARADFNGKVLAFLLA